MTVVVDEIGYSELVLHAFLMVFLPVAGKYSTASRLRNRLENLLPGDVFLDTARSDEENTSSLLFRHPREIIVAYSFEEVPFALSQLDAAVAGGVWAAGFLSYEAGYAFEPKLASKRAETATEPLVWFGLYDVPEQYSFDETEEAMDVPTRSSVVENVQFGLPRASYRAKVERIRAYIYEGDLYQVNFTDAIDFEVRSSPIDLYLQLRSRQHVAYGALLNTGREHVLSLSPELFFRREGKRIWTRPMKGTVRRGRTRREDQRLRSWLADDDKSQAENLMIVDLLRNDLSIVCEPGSVQVPALFSTERYETLFQMTSTIRGRLQQGVDYSTLFRALFPCGSVTGAPKLRAMQRIQELECRPRGVYCGGIGYIAPDERAVFNVAIRTITLRGAHGSMGTGSGIVWDSVPDAEYDECILKGDFLTGRTPRAETLPFDLIETMRADDGRIPLLEYHIDRLSTSAAFFDRPFDKIAFQRQIEHVVESHRGGVIIVRALLKPEGEVNVTVRPLQETKGQYFRRVTWATEPVDSKDTLLYHKTTRRERFKHAYRKARREGYDEALFVNERGEVTEGSRTNVFIEREGKLFTPPVRCGLLAGVYRRYVLEMNPSAAEKVISPEEVVEADAVYVCNAVRGWNRVTVS